MLLETVGLLCLSHYDQNVNQIYFNCRGTLWLWNFGNEDRLDCASIVLKLSFLNLINLDFILIVAAFFRIFGGLENPEWWEIINFGGSFILNWEEDILENVRELSKNPLDEAYI